MAKKKNPKVDKVEVKTKEVASGTVKGTGPIFEYTDEDFKQWCTNIFLKNKGDTKEIDDEFAKMKNLTDEDMDKLLERQDMYNEAIDNLMLFLANEEKSKHPEIFVDPEKVGAVLEDIEVPYGKKITELDPETLDEFLSYAIASGRMMEVEDCLYREDQNYETATYGATMSDARKVYGKYLEKLEMYGLMSDVDRELWEAEVIENHTRLFQSGKLNDLLEVDDGVFVPKPNNHPLKDWGFTNEEPELTMPDEDNVIKDLEPREETIELTPSARESYMKQTLNEFAEIKSDRFGVDGHTIDKDYDYVLKAAARVQADNTITPVAKERIEEMFRRISNDDESFTHLTDEQLKALFYVPKHARWYHRNIGNGLYKRDMLADGYTDEDGLVERKDNESIKISELKKIRDENYTYILNSLSMAVDTLHPKLIEFSKTLSPEEMSMLSVIFKSANIDFEDLHINHTGFAPATSELLINELYEILEAIDETLIPGVRTAKDVVFYLDKIINSKETKINITEYVYKTLIDLAYVGFINPNMTEYIYTATALSMAIEYFTAHPLYKYSDHVSGQEIVVNMLDRINAKHGDRVDPMGHKDIMFLEDQIVRDNNLGGIEMVRLENNAAAIEATAGLKQNVGINPDQSGAFLQASGSVWGDASTNTVTFPATQSKVKPSVVHRDGTPGTNLFPKADDSGYKKLLAGDRSGIPSVVGMPQYSNNFSTTGLVGVPSTPPVAVYNDPMIDRDISIGSGHLCGLPNFACTEEFYYINSNEIAIKYADGRVYIVQGRFIPLIQEIYSMRRKEIEDSIKSRGGFMQPSVYGTSDRIDFGMWNGFPAHVRYKVSSEHDNVWRAELVNNNSLINNNNLGGIEMGKTLQGMEGFGIGAQGMNNGMMNNGMTSAGMAMAGIPTAMSNGMTQPVNNMSPAAQMANVYSAQMNGQGFNNMGVNNMMNNVNNNSNAVIQALQAQIAMMQQQIQALQAQVAAMSAKLQATPAVNNGFNNGYNNYNTMATPAINNFGNNGISMYTANNQVQPMINNGYNTQVPAINNFGNNGMYNGYQAPAMNTVQPGFNNGFANPNAYNPMMPAVNNGYNMNQGYNGFNVNQPVTMPVQQPAQPIYNGTPNYSMQAPIYNGQPTNINAFNTSVAPIVNGGPQNNGLVPNGYGVTTGGYNYTQGLTQNPYAMQAQSVNPQLASWLTPQMQNDPYRGLTPEQARLMQAATIPAKNQGGQAKGRIIYS